MKVQELLEKVVPANIILVADKHIEMYERRLQSDSPNVNHTECSRYQRIWQSIKDKGGVASTLTPEERGELIDAIFEGSYDDILGIPEEYKDQVEVDDDDDEE
jgi:hypothetical protein